MPAQQEVSKNVKILVGMYAHLPVDMVLDDYTLTDPPVSLDANGLVFLTKSLRAYIQHINSASTISLSEVSKTGLTVKQLAELVYKKI